MPLVVAQLKGPTGVTVRPVSKAGDESRTHDSHVGNVMVPSISPYIAKGCEKCISKVSNLVLQSSKSGRSQSHLPLWPSMLQISAAGHFSSPHYMSWKDKSYSWFQILAELDLEW